MSFITFNYLFINDHFCIVWLMVINNVYNVMRVNRIISFYNT